MMMSPGAKVTACDRVAVCSRTDQIICDRSASCFISPFTASQRRPFSTEATSAIGRIGAIGAELSKDREVTVDTDGVLHSKDETGFSIAFQVSDRTVMELDAPEFNLNESYRSQLRI